jgi:hypothetical protein
LAAIARNGKLEFVADTAGAQPIGAVTAFVRRLAR